MLFRCSIITSFNVNIVFQLLAGASPSEPHSYVENGAVVHAQRTAMKNGIATLVLLYSWYGG